MVGKASTDLDQFRPRKRLVGLAVSETQQGRMVPVTGKVGRVPPVGIHQGIPEPRDVEVPAPRPLTAKRRLQHSGPERRRRWRSSGSWSGRVQQLRLRRVPTGPTGRRRRG